MRIEVRRTYRSKRHRVISCVVGALGVALVFILPSVTVNLWPTIGLAAYMVGYIAFDRILLTERPSDRPV
jgi:hypothetical protein